MKHPVINYKLIGQAIDYYDSIGFKYIDVPWIVSAAAMNVTMPSSCEIARAPDMVASGEQSFIELALEKQLPLGKFCCATPCYRPFDSEIGRYHYDEFFKVELIDYIGIGSDFEGAKNILKYSTKFFDTMLGKAGKGKTRWSNTVEEIRHGCKSLASIDIEALTKTGWIELGSYGVRFNETIGLWIYGTGLALPRLEEVIATSKQVLYNDEIT